jgi:hypothetical protein
MAAAAAEALGIEWHDADWRAPLPDMPVRRLPVRLASDAAWMGRHLGPWLMRRARGRSSGDGRLPKRPELTPLVPPASGPGS